MGRVLKMRGVCYVVFTHCIARGCNLRGKLHPLHGFENGQTTFAPSLWSHGACARELGGWGLEAP
jgi:hypothetical protein